MARIFDIRSHSFHADEPLFYDTNIWAAIYQLKGFTPDTAPYTTAHKQVLTVRALIHTDITVLQEIANLLERQSVADVRKSRLGETKQLYGSALKEFRRTQEFGEVASLVADALRQIVRQSVFVPCVPSSQWLLEQIAQYEQGHEGYNDQIIAKLCQDNNFTLVTNDADFAAFDLSILTAHPGLLNTAIQS